MSKLMTLLAGIALMLATASSASAQYGYVYWQGFEGHNSHQNYTQSMLQSDFPGYVWQQGMDTWRTYLSGTSKSGNYALKVSYPAYTSGTQNSGAQFQYNLPYNGKYNELYVEYDVRFSNNFEWQGGGKLPGIGGGGFAATGGNNANGYNGFSSRLMWRQGGRLAAYVYRANHPSGANFGEDFYFKENGNGADIRLQPNRWYRVKMRVHLNDVGQSNGHVAAWLDDKFVLWKGGIEWRKTNNLKIDNFMFSTFPGGGANDPYFTPTQTQSAWFDNFHLFTYSP